MTKKPDFLDIKFTSQQEEALYSGCGISKHKRPDEIISELKAQIEAGMQTAKGLMPYIKHSSSVPKLDCAGTVITSFKPKIILKKGKR